MKVAKIMRIQCNVECEECNESFESALDEMMIPVQGYDAVTNTYTIHVTYKLWTYLQKELRYRNVPVTPNKGYRSAVVNRDEYEESKQNKKFKAE